MAVVAWSTLTLAELSDLEAEVGEGSVLFTAYDVAQCEKAYTAVKKQMLEDLKASITDLFASRNGQFVPFDVVVREQWYSYTTLDTMFDKIGNPDVLTEPFKAKWAWQLWSWLSGDDRPKWAAMAPIILEKMNQCEDQYTKRMRIAKQNFWFDLNDDGQIADQERVRTRNSFVRV
jgi:hypothetical protein